ncbi:MAG: SemiSWEET family transporter [bacterium]|nr:SemiSWEET family transporter [bacterium]
MTLADMLGWSASVATFIFFSVASPTQIIKHYREKKVGLTAFYAAWPLVSHILWCAYGLVLDNPHLIWVNVFALVMIGIICTQKFILYREK